MEIKALDPKVIRKERHNKEVFLFGLSVIATVAVVIAVAYMVIPLISSAVSESGEQDTPDIISQLESAFADESDDGDQLFNMLFIVVGLPLLILVGLYKQYASTTGRSVRVSEKNFPEIYQKSVEFAKKLGMKETPPVYIQQCQGVLNAFAAAILGRRYVQLNAEIVDIAYMEHKDFEGLYFIMAHEFGHQYYNHTTFLNCILTTPSRIIPVYGPLLERAREYSVDRIAQLLAGNDGVDAMMSLIAGRHLYKYVDKADFLDEMKSRKGFFLWLQNLMASHPIMPKRIAALVDPEKKSGKLL